MRTRLSPVALLLSLLLLAAPLAVAAPPTGGDSNTVSSSETWTEDANMAGHVVVSSGSTLTVSANISVETGSSITVEEGGQLVVTNGALVSDDLNAGLMVNIPYATLTLNFGDVAEEGVVQLKFDHVIDQNAKMDVMLGNETVNASGLDLVQFDAPLDGSSLVITFDSYYFTPTYVLWAKAIYGGGNTETHLAQDIQAADAPLYWFQSGFDIHAHGDLTVTSSTLSGANIHCEGLCQFDNAELVGSAPVDAASTATVSVLNSIISGSRSDEDIILHDQAQITYTNSQGTGGTTDAWIRLLSQRSLSTNVPGGSLDIYDMGWGAADWNDLTDESGNVVLVDQGATNEHKRIVEWMDGDGVVQQEAATITLSIASSWGTFSKTIDAPKTSEGTLELDLPYVAVTSVSPETTIGEVNRSVSGMVTITNTGEANVSGVSIWCYQNEDLADTTQMVVSLAAGESKEVPFTWYMYKAGESTLNCKPLLPTALDAIADEVADLSGADSVVITWEYGEEIEEFPLIIWIVVALGFLGLALVVASQARKQATAKSYTAYENAPDEEEAEEEGTEAASDVREDEPAEPEPEEEVKEESNEESTASIYDLKPEE